MLTMQVEDVNGIPTHVFRLKTRSKVESNALLLIVPGNPGMAHFYITFATHLFELGRGAYDVSVVSHAGHSPGVAKPVDSPACKDWYSLEDQLAHKMSYVRQQAANKEVLYLVGHSIGCYIILEMLKQLPPARIKKVAFLFPTIEKMALTPNGKIFSRLFPTYRKPAVTLVGISSWIPDAIRQFVLTSYFLYRRATPEHAEHMARGTMNITGPSLYNILCLAGQEMQDVCELPENIISEHIEKMAFYYGSDDPWTLKSCYEDMIERFPDKDVNLCANGYSHAFVITTSKEMADVTFTRLFHGDQ